MAATDEMCQVSIRTADHEVDVTLPAQVPIAELMPAVVDLIGKDEFAGREPRLTRVSGEVLNTAATLAQSQASLVDLSRELSDEDQRRRQT